MQVAILYDALYSRAGSISPDAIDKSKPEQIAEANLTPDSLFTLAPGLH